MKRLTSKEELDKYISEEDALLVYFSGVDCSVCKVLKPKIESEILENFPKIKTFEVEASKYKEIASNFSVFSIPTILVFFDSKEFKRYGRNISITQFNQELKRPYSLFME
ncbi:thioredoxin family protein [Arcobacter arenosus]|jgi:thioredoxin-like negative regulator of GroEL|uniref:Thioredoxin family protein n=1 Tax=Arcobacter arenosus TaxID=2576037 RepID=A0A5R8Y5P3_9BACT|nr:thioredoxin family protein [Arcobacter arenosus]TLP40983.1 thioredoxin family protein [Arcobacter arenosus]